MKVITKNILLDALLQSSNTNVIQIDYLLSYLSTMVVSIYAVLTGTKLARININALILKE